MSSHPHAEARALIGYTGFVGSSLARQACFTSLYNSTNSGLMVGRRFERVICAGVSAAKWMANADPLADWQRIERLIEVIDRIECDEFILISTIDVYPYPGVAADESESCDGVANHAYGAHRLRLEQWAARRFGCCRIVRLPALFGRGLRKNALYDLLHDNGIEKVNPLAEYQWYPTARLWSDILRICGLQLRLVNLFTEPVSMARIVERCFRGARIAEPREPAPAYRLRTRHAEALGGCGGYLLNSNAVLDEIEHFVTAERNSSV